jgi:hypothetical protein
MSSSAPRSPSPTSPPRPHWLEATLITLASLLAYPLLIGRPVYATDDDVSMEMIAAGVWLAPEPSAQVIFMHPAYGWLLSTLHRLLPGVAWHGWLLVLLIAASHAVFYALLARRQPSRAVRAFAALMLATSLSICLNMLQFTVVAGLCCAAGQLLWLSIPSRNACARAASVLLMLVGVMLRVEGALLATLMLLPVCVAMLRERHAGYGAAFWRQGLFLGSVLLLLGGGSLYSTRSFYSGEAWDAWWRLNAAKTGLIDNEKVPYNPQTVPLYREIGWERVDYDMLHTWQYQNAELFTAEKMNALLTSANAAGVSGGVATGDEDRGGALSQFWEKLTDSPHLSMHYLQLLAVLLLASSGLSRRDRWEVLVWVALAALAVYLGLTVNRLPARLITILVTCAVWGVLLLRTKEPVDRARRGVAWQLALLLAGFTLVTEWHLSRQKLREVETDAQALMQDLQIWQRELPQDALIYAASGGMCVDALSPLQPLEILQQSLRGYLYTGWGNQTPHQVAVHESLGLHGDFFAALAARPHAYLAARNTHDDTLERVKLALKSYYAHHYQIDVSFEASPEVPGLLHMRFKPVPQHPDNPS